MIAPLQKNGAWKGRRGPLVMVIMDGVGYGKYAEGDAVADSKLYAFRALESSCPATRLKAHGLAVGLPADDDMGNSEVGHNAIGCGRVFAQGAKLVSASIETGAMFEGSHLEEAGIKTRIRRRRSHALHRPVFGWQCTFPYRPPQGHAGQGQAGWGQAGKDTHICWMAGMWVNRVPWNMLPPLKPTLPDCPKMALTTALHPVVAGST
jgi:hypothetical protein